MGFQEFYLNILFKIGPIFGSFPTPKFLTLNLFKGGSNSISFQIRSLNSIYTAILAVIILQLGFRNVIPLNSSLSEILTTLVHSIELYGFDCVFKLITLKSCCKNILNFLTLSSELEIDALAVLSQYRPVSAPAQPLQHLVIIGFGFSISLFIRITMFTLIYGLAIDVPNFTSFWEFFRFFILVYLDFSVMVGFIVLIGFTVVPAQIVMKRFLEFSNELEEAMMFSNTKSATMLANIQKHEWAHVISILPTTDEKLITQQRKNNAVLELHQKFLKIKHLFEIYQDFAGNYILILIIRYTMWGVITINHVFFNGLGKSGARAVTSARDKVFENNAIIYITNTAMYAVGILQSFGTLWFVASLGNEMVTMIEKEKAKLLDMDSNNCEDKVLKRILKSICRWNWKLNAKNILTVDYGLVNLVVGAIMTYTIFMLQLHMSEASK